MSLRKLQNPSANRNKQPILEIIKQFFNKNDKGLKLLEISSGTGEHCTYFAPNFPNITFQPSEFDRQMFESIKAHIADCSTNNIQPPIFVDISQPAVEWDVKFNNNSFDYMMNINMMHISPIQCSEGLFLNAGMLLKPKGLLITYGPYAENGILTPESNVRFNQSLMQRNREWGIRDICDLKRIGEKYGIIFKQWFSMPANNFCAIWEKRE